ncbi:hypothetical protein G5S_0062 [Chlamydia pecorum E58]|uniref:Uncharacterized protein n=1 Tax=Chlamydia pecorum (strain ATCC VR-628 / DSM 29919 / E58) TaxID=331635 RepID=A0AA34WHI8_CHLPE|nr:hypothetical protein G5S_0062 [Chlamydia pecorum E58]
MKVHKIPFAFSFLSCIISFTSTNFALSNVQVLQQ